MSVLGSVSLEFEVEPDNGAVGEVLAKLKEAAEAEPDHDFIGTPLAWVRNGERRAQCREVPNHYYFDGYVCDQACAGTESSFKELDELMGELAPSVSYKVDSDNFNTFNGVTVDEWRQECTALA